VFIGTHPSRRLAARFDVSISRFSVQQTRFVMADVVGPCWGRCPVDQGSVPVGVAALTANGIATVTNPNRGGRLYLIAGVGPYYIYQHPEVANAVSASPRLPTSSFMDGAGDGGLAVLT
jgi:hypothetical protein